jgi:para-aminobenzoate synthetase component 1
VKNIEMQGFKESYILEGLLEIARKSSVACVYVSNGFEDFYGQWQWLCGFEVERLANTLSDVDLSAEHPWFGYIAYDYKNSIEQRLQSIRPPLAGFEDVKFFQPKIWLGMGRDGQIQGNEAGLSFWRKLRASQLSILGEFTPKPIQWRPLTQAVDYLKQIDQIKAHIVEGDFYEMNHCIAFTAEATLDPYQTFFALNQKAPAPFASFVKDGSQYLMCASPERYIAQDGQRLVSQPIKGTRRRTFGIAEDQANLDAKSVASLKVSVKDRAENIMIVDLVRNDLSRVCQPGTVHVPELCGVYSYSHVHQMISTVIGETLPTAKVKDVIHASFPMGSMTGAPKIAVMEHTNHLENFSRGIYSGTVGYVWKGRMDFNVVIRALVYDQTNSLLSYAVGGAITIDSDAREEYQECLDKAATMLSIFQ